MTSEQRRKASALSKLAPLWVEEDRALAAYGITVGGGLERHSVQMKSAVESMLTRLRNGIRLVTEAARAEVMVQGSQLCSRVWVCTKVSVKQGRVAEMGLMKLESGLDTLHSYERELNDWCSALRSRLATGSSNEGMAVTEDGARLEEQEMQQERHRLIVEVCVQCMWIC